MSDVEDDADYYHDAGHADGTDTLEAQQVPSAFCIVPSIDSKAQGREGQQSHVRLRLTCQDKGPCPSSSRPHAAMRQGVRGMHHHIPSQNEFTECSI